MKATSPTWLIISAFAAVVPAICMADSSLSSKDKQFMEKAARAGHAEVAAGKLASSNASNDQVKKFGDHMVQDHGKAGNELLRARASLCPKSPMPPIRSLQPSWRTARAQTSTGSMWRKPA